MGSQARGPDETVSDRGPARLAPVRAGGDVDPLGTEDQARIGFVGKRLGRFLITAELGRGGMATVYRARDPQIGRDVALKVIHGFFAGRSEIEARFRREANAVAAIRHPSILALYDFAPPSGEEPGYIVSELIEGPGLRRLVEDRGGRLLPEVAALVAIRVAEALGAAHAAGIVHRDVKPDNVLIDRSGDLARVVLTDFGVAHVSGLDTMTATGAVLGSPAYMSPEQARGDDVRPSSDVFSLGILLYQLCTGHLPFSGKDPLMVITALLRGEYVRPTKLDPRVGSDLEQVITRCLAPDPAARFHDGAAAADALRKLLITAGLSDEQAALRRYLDDPDGFEREVSPGIARGALAAADHARRHRQIPRALAEVGRALAYAPNDAAARELLEKLGSRGRSLGMRAGLLAAVTATAIAAMVGGRGAINRPTRPPGSAPTAAFTGTNAVVGAITATAAAMVAGNVPTPPPPPQSEHAMTAPRQTVRISTSAAPISPARRGPRGAAKQPAGDVGDPHHERHGSAPTPLSPTTSATSAATEATGQSPKIGAQAPGEPASFVAAHVASAETSSIVLRASHGFCEPSLDDSPPSLRASYSDLAPGPHEVFCTLPQGGGKVHVATYDLRPGKRPSLIIVPGPDGRPTLGRPE